MDKQYYLESIKLLWKGAVRKVELSLLKLVPSKLAKWVLQRRGMVVGITSNRNFYETTVPVCVKSLIESGFPPQQIYFFIGGYDARYEKVDIGFGVNAYKCPHNSIDFTALVSIIELELTEKYWFLVHDTVEFEKQFYDLIAKALFFRKKKVYSGPSMNIGCYDESAIERASRELLTIKNSSKAWGVKTEDRYIRHLPPICTNVLELGVSDVYGSGVLRHVEHYKRAGLIKNKANKNIAENFITDV